MERAPSASEDGAGEFDAHEAERTGARLRQLTERHEHLLRRLAQVAENSQETKPRSNLQRLFVDAVLLGSRNDGRDLSKVKAGREVLMSSVKASAGVLASRKATGPRSC